MKIISSCKDMMEYSSALKKTDSIKIGLVPTMGALHDGHISLLEAAKRYCDCTIMSIFVNPAQFGPTEDFDKYPRLFEKDGSAAERAGCDCLFAPPVGDMYPEGYRTYINVESITTGLCGASRPTHFRGVATVVLKLFNIVSPQIAVFGSKDAQQLIVIKRMVDDLNLPIRIIAAPTVREKDGLAMSSRNAYLSKDERASASLIYKSLLEAKNMYDNGNRDCQSIKERVKSTLNDSGLIKTEYVEIVDVVEVKPLDELNCPALVAVACRLTKSDTRLIDNIVLGGDLF